MISFSILMCLFLSTALTIAGCGGDEHSQSEPSASPSDTTLNGDFSGSGPGTLIAATTLPNIDPQLKLATSLAARITYTSTSGINDNPGPVTGTVFVPKGSPPEGGWPMIAFGHPPTGILSECAPSSSPTLLGSATTVSALVSAGYLVTVSDYQGLGLDKTYHPYLDSTTLGYNLIHSVRAARKLVPDTSDRWVALGASEGGQAVWAANELVENSTGGLQLLGVVSVSPIADINDLADVAAAGQLTKAQQLMLQAYLASLKKEYSDFDLDAFRRGIVQQKWDVLSSCQSSTAEERAKVADQITADDLRPNPEAVEILHGYLQKTNLPQGPALAPMLVMYGGQDPLIPPEWTDRALDRACKMGDVIQVRVQPDKRDADIDVPTALDWIKARFNGDPAPNDCQAFTAAYASRGEGK